MPELILHHFAASPFSEKLRLILGYKQLSWKSVTVPGIMPKPDVVALTGGYRRTPFPQIGADIYCDTALAAKCSKGSASTGCCSTRPTCLGRRRRSPTSALTIR